MLVFVFFNDTATTEIYTYGHTLSLHDALPISWKKSVVATRSGSGIEVSRREARTTDIPSAWTRSAVAIAAAKPRLVAAKEMPCPLDENISLRSEEHTSELQSLMRISYAVFCLKKKKNKYTNTTIHLITIYTIDK